ncbi:alpha/beta hydrolase [Actinophytocola xanthii]|uniref:Alpha/beta hydrolase n=1 Tax=Actinophytocola xanthii TaxID=1912961 RepID=A0A1Q8CVV4_9PSEU|nr:alpha/beta hydrolase [Actinophytocola xanthii]OLF18485.1 alpha/beta hydrolase [Actinophytocola xanthii]
MDEGVRRTKVAFGSGGVDCAGYLYEPPAPAGGPLSCVVMAHGFAGTMEFLLYRAQRFAEAGFAALVFDYRYFGASEGRPRQLLDIPAQLDDWRAAIRYARGHAAVDERRIALWGSSLGGGHVVTVAAEDPAVAAVVAQVPWLGDGRPWGRRLSHALRWNSVKLTVAAVRDARGARRGAPPLLVPVVGEPGSGAMFTDPSARRAVDAAGLENVLWRNEFTPRAALSLARYEPGRHLERLTAPLLVCATEGDTDIPVDFLRAAVARAPRGELRRYPGTHFEIYYGPTQDEVIADQTAFLRDALA